MYRYEKAHVAGLPLLLFLLSLVCPPPAPCLPPPCTPGGGIYDSLFQQACVGHPIWRDALPGPVRPGTIDLLLRRATERNLISGGVVLVGNSGGILSVTARGRLDSKKDAPLLDERTIFDLASLTKVVATAPAVMVLLDQGKISLSDPLARWFAEFRGSRHRKITIGKLLTHTSGLTDIHLRPGQSIRAVVRQAAREKFPSAPGSHFEYADINFILLAELVHRASGKPLNVFCRDQIYAPLGMRETMFRPPGELSGELAPTLGPQKRYYKGVPQDADARQLGGVAGHAGLFSSARDLSRYARLMLGRGSLEGSRIISERVISVMTAPHLCGRTGVTRGLGWDMDSPFSAPRGTLFSKSSFGHTGYSGSSIWIDPRADLFVILLTNRSNYRDTAKFNQLRRDVSSVAAAQFAKLDSVTGLSAQEEVSRIIGAAAQKPAANLRAIKTSPKRHYAAHLRKQRKVAGMRLNKGEKRGNRVRPRV